MYHVTDPAVSNLININQHVDNESVMVTKKTYEVMDAPRTHRNNRLIINISLMIHYTVSKNKYNLIAPS